MTIIYVTFQTDIWTPLPSLIFGILGTVGGLLALLLPETLGKSMPESINDIGKTTNTIR